MRPLVGHDLDARRPSVSRRRTGECSKISMPRSSAARASPTASLPGCTSAFAVRLEHRAEIGGRGDGCLHLRPDRDARRRSSPRSAASCAHSSSHSSWCGSVATASAPDALPLGVDAPLGDVGPHRVEVRHAEPVELVDLVGPAAQAVVAAVREARFAESAVATGCRPPDRPRLDERDARVGVAAAGEQRGPQAGVAAADDHEVGVVVAAQRGPIGGWSGRSSSQKTLWRVSARLRWMTDAAGRCRSKTVVPTGITSLSARWFHLRRASGGCGGALMSRTCVAPGRACPARAAVRGQASSAA